MSEFDANAPLDMGELDIRKSTTPEIIVVNGRSYEATTSIGTINYFHITIYLF